MGGVKYELDWLAKELADVVAETSWFAMSSQEQDLWRDVARRAYDLVAECTADDGYVESL